MTVREPLLTTVTIVDLRPTQITVGMREVLAKRKRWRETAAKKGGKFLGKHMIPVMLGPKHRNYVVDHHHLARALHDEGVKDVAVTVMANLSALDAMHFGRSWITAIGCTPSTRRPPLPLPRHSQIGDRLVDDPFRSLAGELRRAGGFAKDTTPFSEFIWADFLRRRLSVKPSTGFGHALEEALELAKSSAAGYLPDGAVLCPRNDHSPFGRNPGASCRAAGSQAIGTRTFSPEPLCERDYTPA